MRQSERVVPGRYLTEDERAKSIAQFMDWYANRRPTEVEAGHVDDRWAKFFKSPQRYRWSAMVGREKSGGGTRGGR